MKCASSYEERNGKCSLGLSYPVPPIQRREALGRWDSCKCTSSPSERDLDFSGPLPSLVDFTVIYRLHVKVPQCIRRKRILSSYLVSHKA